MSTSRPRWLRRLGLPLALLLPLVAAADDPPSPAARSPEEAATEAQGAFERGDIAALEALAGQDRPDPWLVADELCDQGAHDAALAFARAAPRKAVEALPRYVESRRGRDRDEVAHAALDAALAAVEAGRVEEALAAAAQVGDTLDSPTRIHLVTVAAIALQEAGRRAESVAAFLRAARAAETLGWLVRAAAALQQAAVTAEAAGDGDGALAAYRERLPVLEALREPSAIGSTQLRIGNVEEGMPGRLDEAERSYERARTAFETAGDRAGVGFALWSLANVEYLRNEYARALELYTDSRALGEEAGDERLVMHAETGMGSAMDFLGDLLGAVEIETHALALARKLQDDGSVAALLNNLGNVQERLGRYEEARISLRDALSRYERLDDEHGVALVWGNLGNVQVSLGRYSEAYACFQRALEMRARLGLKLSVANVLGDMANLQAELGQDEESLATNQRSLELAESLGDRRSVSRTLTNMAHALDRLGRTDEAIEKYRRALVLKEALGDAQGLTTVYLGLADTQRDAGAYEEARENYGKALDLAETIGDAPFVASVLGNLGLLERSQGHPAAARRLFGRALDLLEDSPNLTSLTLTSMYVGDLDLAEGRAAQAVTLARAGVERLAESMAGLAEDEGTTARDGYVGLFDVGYRAASRTRDADALLWFIEQGRSFFLREGLGSRSALESAVVPPELLDALNAGRRAERAAHDAYGDARRAGNLLTIRGAQMAWNQARARLEAAAARIEREAKRVAEVVLPEPDDAERVRADLRPEEALVLYALTSEETIALVLRPGGARVVSLGATDEVSDAVAELLDAKTPPVEGAVDRLRELLVDPLSLGADVERVLVSPMGNLGYVPFALLMPAREVVFVPSGTTYGQLRRESPLRGEGVLAFGDPDYETTVDVASLAVFRGGSAQALSRLPATRAEVEAIADVPYLGARASESEFPRAVSRRERWRSVHLACHGILDAEHPTLSALALAADDGNDGFLTALEILRMRVPADLVVLSACETAKGRIYGTEGIVGLTRAFMFAGAPRVICSLWKVDDEATRALMMRFYELWNPKDGSAGLGAAAALKQAQAFVRSHEQWQAPYYWAAWVLWGLPH